MWYLDLTETGILPLDEGFPFSEKFTSLKYWWHLKNGMDMTTEILIIIEFGRLIIIEWRMLNMDRNPTLWVWSFLMHSVPHIVLRNLPETWKWIRKWSKPRKKHLSSGSGIHEPFPGGKLWLRILKSNDPWIKNPTDFLADRQRCTSTSPFSLDQDRIAWVQPHTPSHPSGLISPSHLALALTCSCQVVRNVNDLSGQITIIH